MAAFLCAWRFDGYVIIYTILSAVAGMALVVIVDILITKIFDEKSILQKNCIKMPLSYFIGILGQYRTEKSARYRQV